MHGEPQSCEALSLGGLSIMLSCIRHGLPKTLPAAVDLSLGIMGSPEGWPQEFFNTGCSNDSSVPICEETDIMPIPQHFQQQAPGLSAGILQKEPYRRACQSVSDCRCFCTRITLAPSLLDPGRCLYCPSTVCPDTPSPAIA